MVKSAPASAFKVTQAQFLLQFLIVALNDLARVRVGTLGRLRRGCGFEIALQTRSLRWCRACDRWRGHTGRRSRPAYPLRVYLSQKR
jgi:hypothetical protein